MPRSQTPDVEHVVFTDHAIPKRQRRSARSLREGECDGMFDVSAALGFATMYF